MREVYAAFYTVHLQVQPKYIYKSPKEAPGKQA